MKSGERLGVVMADLWWACTSVRVERAPMEVAQAAEGTRHTQESFTFPSEVAWRRGSDASLTALLGASAVLVSAPKPSRTEGKALVFQRFRGNPRWPCRGRMLARGFPFSKTLSWAFLVV